ncbi:MAG TPA: lipoprotein insertase outer membrane protein LolB [Gammaproteobacteria bacterium]|nr:lipoprotein insertase outer membrane protein LolB [Gammaproteobacteria bacterium]
MAPFHSAPPDARQWQQHQQNMVSISHWQLLGKLAMHNGHDGGQVDVFWQQQDEQNYEIKLVAPFGAGTTVVTAVPGQVMLATSRGENITADNIEQLLAQIPDWTFPVTGLRFWVLGIPSPQSTPGYMRWHEQGGLAVMEQDGWRIELENYAPSGNYYLPRKIFMRRVEKKNSQDDVELKLVIRQWMFP